MVRLWGLLQHPGSGRAIGGDHYVAVYEVDDETVHFHDPHGFPYSTLPIPDFVAAGRGELLGYDQASYRFATRFDFRRERGVDTEAAIRACIPQAIEWLGRASDGDALAGAAALERLAAMVVDGLEPGQHGHLVHFAVKVGARRLTDAARWLAAIGAEDASEVADRQARLLGRLQYELVARKSAAAADTLMQLAPSYEDLRGALM